MKIDPQSIKDVARIFVRPFTPASALKWLQDLRAILPLIQEADKPGGQRACLYAFLEKHGKSDFATLLIPRCIEELCHYPPDARGPIIDAAVTLATPAACSSHRLDDMLPTVLAEFQGLDERTRAILTVMEELRHADGDVNTGFCNIPDHLGPVDVDILRQEPGLATTMRAYDAACVILENPID